MTTTSIVQRVPNARRRLPSLDLMVNVAILATCVAVVAGIWAKWDRGGPTRAELPFVEGTAAPKLAGVNYGAAPGTMVMYLRSTCRFCTESMPFYKSLAERREGGLRLIAVGDESPAVLRAYLAQHGVNVDEVVLDQMRSIPTPTVLLVSKGGKVKNVWLGRQDETGQSKVRAALTSIG